jgi:cold-inducible RNA-binding protein
MGKKLYVGNLSYSVTDRDLNEKFSQCGTVESAILIRDQDSGRPKGFGFVEMSTEEEAAQAISKLHASDFSGRPMTVNEAKPMAPRSGGGSRDGSYRGRTRY